MGCSDVSNKITVLLKTSHQNIYFSLQWIFKCQNTGYSLFQTPSGSEQQKNPLSHGACTLAGSSEKMQMMVLLDCSIIQKTSLRGVILGKTKLWYIKVPIWPHIQSIVKIFVILGKSRGGQLSQNRDARFPKWVFTFFCFNKEFLDWLQSLRVPPGPSQFLSVILRNQNHSDIPPQAPPHQNCSWPFLPGLIRTSWKQCRWQQLTRLGRTPLRNHRGN